VKGDGRWVSVCRWWVVGDGWWVMGGVLGGEWLVAGGEKWLVLSGGWWVVGDR
jgi:hypothetical protein